MFSRLVFVVLGGCLGQIPGQDPCEFALDSYCNHDPALGGPTASGCETLVFPNQTVAGKLRTRCVDGRFRLADLAVENRQEDIFSADGEHQATRYYGGDEQVCSSGLVTYGLFQSCLQPCALDPGTDGIPACD